MHFGKRPVNQAPPTILVPDSFNLYQHDGQQDQAAIRSGRLSRALLERFNKSPSPYLFSIQLDQGQTLEALPDGKFFLSSNDDWYFSFSQRTKVGY